MANLTAAQKIHGAFLLGMVMMFCICLVSIWEAQADQDAEGLQFAAVVLERVKAAASDEHARGPEESPRDPHTVIRGAQ